MTENKRFILTEQFNGLQGVTFVKDDCADVDTYYTVGGTVDLLNQLLEENEELKKENEMLNYMIGRNNNYITDLMSFIKSKGYTLKDFLKYVGQFRIVGVNKEDWND